MRGIEPSQLVRADWLPRAVIAGFSAAVAMLLGFFLAYGLARAGARSGLPEPLPGWLYSLSHNSLTDLAGANLYAIAGAHFVVAIGLALVYARFAEPALPGPSWLRGAEFAIIPWLLSIFVVLPLQGGGLLGASLGAGPLPVLGNLLLHALYGATLGTVYGPLGDLTAENWVSPGSSGLATDQHQEVPMAKGIGVGLLIGLAGGLVATLIQGASGRPATGLPAAGLVLGWALVGGAFGALIGSFVRLRVAPDDVVLALQPDEAPATDEAATLMVTGIQARHDHAGARVGALVGSVAIGPLGMPIGAAAGAVVDAMTPGPDAPPSHTHNIELNPCYDGCPAWRHSRK